MNFSVSMLDACERPQFLESFEENIDLLLELLEAVRCESANIDDFMAAEFMAGIAQLVRVFRQSHRLEDSSQSGRIRTLDSELE